MINKNIIIDGKISYKINKSELIISWMWKIMLFLSNLNLYSRFVYGDNCYSIVKFWDFYGLIVM